MANILADYETKSSLDIRKVGRIPYLRDSKAGIVCLSYKIDDTPTRLWVPGMSIPDVFSNTEGHTYYAFNIKFDAAVTAILGAKYSFKPWPLTQCVDVMALCGRFTFPQKLSNAGKALALRVQKDRRGANLMKKICSPPFKYTQEELKAFFKYCITDVDTMYEMIQSLPNNFLGGQEKDIWENTSAINDRGLPIDHAAVARINEVIDYHTKKLEAKLPLLTDEAVHTAGQRDKIITWAKGFDVELPNLQAATVEEAITLLDGYDESRTPEEQRNVERVVSVLKIRKELGGAAVKKYKRLLDMTYKGRLFDTLRYCGAGHTGRDSGVGFQLQNLPRLSVPDPPAAIQQFYDTSILREPDPMRTAKALIRSMIRAKKGNTILAADYGSIEYVMLMWFCGEWGKLKDFEKGICPYKTFATHLMGIPYEDVTKEQRQNSKPGILGGGYCLGGKSLIPYAADMGVIIPHLAESNRIINIFRSEHPNVESTWDLLTQASVDAVRHAGEIFPVHSAKFQAVRDRTGRPWLAFTLPSNRVLFYCEPTLGKHYGRDIVQYMGVNSKTKQWTRHTFRASVAINNCIQGIARDVMMRGSLDLTSVGYHIVGRVHDEFICEEKLNSEFTLERMIKIMCDRPAWCKAAPIRADGFAAERYRK